jgi:hypothetical protein
MPDSDYDQQSGTIEAASSQIIKKEMPLFEASKTRPENLEKLFLALKSIPPTSVEAERVLDARSFLRQYFIKNKST